MTPAALTEAGPGPVAWREVAPELARWQRPDGTLPARPVPGPGVEETDLWLVGDPPRFVVKVWRPHWPVAVEAEHAFLRGAFERGLPAPEPLGWGFGDGGARPVLAMRYAGETPTPAGPADARALAATLAGVHATPVSREDVWIHNWLLDLGSLVTHFFPRLLEYPDLRAAAERAVEGATPAPPALIHGDVTMPNLLFRDGRATLVDWGGCGGRVGDPRYDAAWASLLLHVYVDPSARLAFIDEYSARAGLDRSDWGRFEALGALRWLLIDRWFPLNPPEATRAAFLKFAAAYL